jgi:hypothetical protein
MRQNIYKGRLNSSANLFKVLLECLVASIELYKFSLISQESQDFLGLLIEDADLLGEDSRWQVFWMILPE